MLHIYIAEFVSFLLLCLWNNDSGLFAWISPTDLFRTYVDQVNSLLHF